MVVTVLSTDWIDFHQSSLDRLGPAIEKHAVWVSQGQPRFGILSPSPYSRLLSQNAWGNEARDIKPSPSLQRNDQRGI
jgi:hypothetical protein